MNKPELVSKIAESADITKTTAEKALKSTLGAIAKALANDESVVFIGFGSFSVTTRAARIGRNPKTGKEIKIAEKKIVKFRAGKNLKDAIYVKPKNPGGCASKTCKTKKK
jgi:DNA-binding protein HU-beta